MKRGSRGNREAAMKEGRKGRRKAVRQGKWERWKEGQREGGKP